MASIVTLPYEYFFDPDSSQPISNGFVYVGVPDLDPEIPANQLPVTLRQEDGTEVLIDQSVTPIRTGGGGGPEYNGSPVQVLVDGAFSIKVLDSLGAQKFYAANVLNGASLTEETGVVAVPLLADLIQVDITITKQVAVSGRTAAGDAYEGDFNVISGDQSINVTNDPLQGIYVAPASDPSGVSGAWKRVYTSVSVLWFGATTAAWQAALDTGEKDIVFPYTQAGYIATTDLITATADQKIRGEGNVRYTGGKISLAHSGSEISGFYFYDTLAKAVLLQADYTKAYKNTFDNIGSGFISGVSSTPNYACVHVDGAAAARKGIEVQKNLFVDMKGDSCVRIDGANPCFADVSKNTFRNTRFYGVKIGTSSPGQGVSVCENKFFDIGSNFDAGDTGLACTAIYAPDDQPASIACNNIIHTAAENGIEGGFGIIEGNGIIGCGTDPGSGSYTVGSRYAISTVYGSVISNNNCSGSGLREINVLSVGDNVNGMNITDNYLAPLAGNKGVYISISGTGEANSCEVLGNKTVGGDGDFLRCEAGGKSVWRDNTGKLDISGQVIGWDFMQNKSVRQTSKRGTTDNTATEIFKITTTDETTNDGGTWSAILTCQVMNNSSASANSCAVLAGQYAFCRAMDASGAGGLSAVTEIYKTASATTNLGARDIGTVTVTVAEATEFDVRVSILIDGIGTSGAVPIILADLQVFYSDFTTEPGIEVV